MSVMLDANCFLFTGAQCTLHSNCSQYTVMSNFVQQFSGRKRESTVWKYFEEQANLRKSKCLVPDAKGRICGHLVAGKNATNLKAHLSVHHSEQFKELSEAEQEKKTAIKRKLDASGALQVNVEMKFYHLDFLKVHFTFLLSYCTVLECYIQLSCFGAENSRLVNSSNNNALYL